MPSTQFLTMQVNGQELDLPFPYADMISISYVLSEPETFEQKQSAVSFDITVPATPNNDKVFNTFHNPEVEDMTTGQLFKQNMNALIAVNGSVVVLQGLALLSEAGYTELPEDYTLDMWGSNGDWVLLAQNITLWDCLPTDPHNFDVATVQASWAADGTDEALSYVYAPVRYRSPWGSNNSLTQPFPPINVTGTQASIYDLRPSLFIYWMLVRFFRLFGYTLNSQFMDTNYFRRLVMPWTWGDFYDITSDMLVQLGFKAAGVVCRFPSSTYDSEPIGYIYAGETGDPIQFFYDGFDPPTPLRVPNTYFNNPGGDRFYIASYNYVGGGAHTGRTYFRMNVDYPPNGYNNFGASNFQFLETGTGSGLYPGAFNYNFNPPPSLSAKITGTVTLEFSLSLCARISCTRDIHLWVFATVVSGHTVTETAIPILNLSMSAAGSVGSLSVPTQFTFSVPGVHVGDEVYLNLVYDTSGGGTILIYASEWINQGTFTGTPSGSFLDWIYQYSSMQMTGLSVDVGGEVNFQWYDAFRNYPILDFLGGLVDLFNLEIQTDPINKVVTIEPMFEGSLPTSGGESYQGYFNIRNLQDWTAKQDLSKRNVMQQFSDYNRQIDFTFKQDGSDGAQNIWAARYKGIYLNNNINSQVNNTNIENGIIAGVPGASRYMLPNRFQRGNTQKTNRFFSALMHYNETAWNSIGGVSPQLPCIFPENISDSSAGTVTQIFVPKIAWYKGQAQPQSEVGGWYYIGIPNDPTAGTDDYGNYLPTYGPSLAATFLLPQMFAVNYNSYGADDPVLTYCDQNNGGTVRKGLMRQFFLPRLALMRNGQLHLPWVHLNLRDITNWEHRECIIIGSSIYALIGIDNYKPLSDDSTQCKMWRVVPPEQTDLDNSYPSQSSILDAPALLSQFDLRYSPLLMYQTDIPQV